MQLVRPHPGPLPQEREKAARTSGIVQAHAEELLKPMRDRLNTILAIVAQEFGLVPGDLNKSMQAILPARRAAAVLAAEFLNPPMHLEVLADWLGVSEATLYRFKSIVRLERQRSFDYETRLNRLHGRIREAIKQSPVADRTQQEERNRG